MMRKTIITICRTAQILKTEKNLNEVSENKGGRWGRTQRLEDNSGGFSPHEIPVCQCTSCGYPRKQDINLLFRGL